MKSHLMFKDQDFNPEQPLLPHHDDLFIDLELEVLLKVMAAGDNSVFQSCKTVLLSSTNDPATLDFRQDILKDCLRNPQVARDLYGITLQVAEKKKKRWSGIFSHYPRGVLSSAVNLMQMFAESLRTLREVTDHHADQFMSEGFLTFFEMIRKELDDAYLDEMDEHLSQLKFKAGAWISARLGSGNEGQQYSLRLPNEKHRNWFKEMINSLLWISSPYTFTVDSRDQAGVRALSDIQDRGLNQAANALAQAAEHVEAFFNNLHDDLTFYIGCLNLADHLEKLESPITIPSFTPADDTRLSFKGLYDPCLAITMDKKVIANTLNADEKNLFVITGANQGGKSTYLRSLGLAQLMAQAGMFVAAEAFSANLCEGIFTHFKRKEDETMKSGKLDEELDRMSAIVDQISPKAMLLLNESFSATNEQEGSEIARQIVSAMLDHQVKVVYVTHMYELAHSLQQNGLEKTIFLRAERTEDGTRTFKLIEASPLQTSFAEDVYTEVFKPSFDRNEPIILSN